MADRNPLAGVPVTVRTLPRLGLPLAFRIIGEGAGPAVVLQHGAKDHGRSWDFVAARFLAEGPGMRLVVPDLRGHGDSGHVPGGGYEGIEYATDFVFLLEALVAEGLAPRFRVVGHSLGGNIASHAAAVRPGLFESLVVIEGVGTPPALHDRITERPPAVRWAEAVGRRLGSEARALRRMTDPDHAARKLRQVLPDAPDAIVAHLATHGIVAADGGYRWKYDPALSMTPLRPEAPAEYAALYADVTCPVLMLYGRKSFATPPSEDGRGMLFPDARISVFEEAGHWLHHDRLGDAVAAIRRFWTETSAQ